MRFVFAQKRLARLRLTIVALSLVVSLQSQDSLKPNGFTELGGFRLVGSVPSDLLNMMVYDVLRSPDLAQWERAVSVQHWPFIYEDVSAVDSGARFYRLGIRIKGTDDDQKNLIVIPRAEGSRYLDEPFFAFQSGGSSSQPVWVKFAILLNQPDRVMFQNSRQYTFHYDFARRRLPGFSELTRPEFDAVSLHPGEQQRIVLGSVLYPRYSGANEVGIQFVGLEPYSNEAVAGWYRLVRSTVNAPAETRFFYMPVFEQSALDPQDVEFFADRGVSVASPDRWSPGNGVYSEGWALGRVRFVTGADIETAFAQGRLRADEILLTDAVPSEVPFVAGIISLSPATPNSHVAILAKSIGVPFAYLRDENDRAAAKSLVGKEIYFSAISGFFFNSASDTRVRMIPIAEDFPGELRTAMLDLKVPSELKYSPKATLNQVSKEVRELTVEDIQYFGGKAANFGILRRELPDRSPEAVALSFDLWDAFMNQTLARGGTLLEWIRNRLSGFSWPVADPVALEQALGEIRTAIQDGVFADAERKAIVEALLRFDPSRKIRFRSSTNVEDSDSFVGAGLYDSFSGCLSDDTDNDEVGPSGCDPMEPKERGVFRAIRKVYASFYHVNAYLERLRHGVREDEVGMAVLVHHSFPDETELANGVAVVRESFGDRWEAEVVCQKGAVSVSNPDSRAIPESVRVTGNNNNIGFMSLSEASSLVVPGAHVMEWEEDYRTLAVNLFKVYNAYRNAGSAPAGLQLDFEFKNVLGDGIVIKQVRRLIQPESREISPFLLNEPVRLATAQGEAFQGALGRHRLKSRWLFKLANSRLGGARPGGPLLEELEMEYLDGHSVLTRAFAVSTLPEGAETITNQKIRLAWTMRINDEDVAMSVEMEGMPEKTSAAGDIATTVRDLRLTVMAQYQTGQPEFVFQNGRMEVGTTKVDVITLSVDNSDTELSPRSSLQSREFKSKNGAVSIASEFYWPPPPSGPSAGYTAPVEKWKETVVRGIGDEPIVLRGFFSQTYVPGHHNFFESYIFDPRAEASQAPGIIELMDQRNVKWLVCDGEPGMTGSVRFIGLDGKLREDL